MGIFIRHPGFTGPVYDRLRALQVLVTPPDYLDDRHGLAPRLPRDFHDRLGLPTNIPPWMEGSYHYEGFDFELRANYKENVSHYYAYLNNLRDLYYGRKVVNGRDYYTHDNYALLNRVGFRGYRSPDLDITKLPNLARLYVKCACTDWVVLNNAWPHVENHFDKAKQHRNRKLMKEREKKIRAAIRWR